MQQMIIAGYWDVLLTSSLIIDAINILYLILSVGFITLGILNILDWGGYKKLGSIDSFRIKIPAFSMESRKNNTRIGGKGIAKLIAVILLTAFCGLLLNLMGAIYPQAEYMYIVHSFGVSGGNIDFVNFMFLHYSVAMSLPMIIAWIVMIVAKFSKTKKLGFVLYFKGIMAALLCASGAGLGYFVIRNMGKLNS
jgi:hypothetical protein